MTDPYLSDWVAIRATAICVGDEVCNRVGQKAAKVTHATLEDLNDLDGYLRVRVRSYDPFTNMELPLTTLREDAIVYRYEPASPTSVEIFKSRKELEAFDMSNQYEWEEAKFSDITVGDLFTGSMHGPVLQVKTYERYNSEQILITFTCVDRPGPFCLGETKTRTYHPDNTTFLNVKPLPPIPDERVSESREELERLLSAL